MEVALSWYLDYQVCSNVEIAVLSNVCRSWRSAISRKLVDDAQNHNPTLMASSAFLLPSMLRQVAAITSSESDCTEILSSKESFCVCWFAPEGIRAVDILQQSDESAHKANKDDHNEFDNWLKHKSDPRSGHASAFGDHRHRIFCCDEWRGYRTAYSVLKHFGYSELFLQEMLRLFLTENTSEGHMRDKVIQLVPPEHFAVTPFVRGATIARPESYCLCVVTETHSLRSILHHKRDSLDSIRRGELRQAITRRNRKERELQRDVFPRVIVSNPHKGRTSTTSGTYSVGKILPSVQFLNYEASHAVCMMTPPFEQGPIPEPITIFLVGIATEDGCFLSGLHHRFELGHLYPPSSLDEATEMSPFCLVTERWTPDNVTTPDNQASSLQPGQSMRSNDSDRFVVPDVDNMDVDDEDSSCSKSDDKRCSCIFQGAGEKIDEIEDENIHRLQRGRLAPGAWHLYVAVFDGERSRIRIDGVEDEITGQKNGESFRALLDGLTIGSDHCFGMSLCSGQGTGGDGAIAELAVFHGILPDLDIQAMEENLMVKHGIPVPSSTLWRDNSWERHAHALLTVRNAHVQVPHAVPLRFLAQHSSVAWNQQSPVTGEEVRITRIGCRPGASSSDW